MENKISNINIVFINCWNQTDVRICMYLYSHGKVSRCIVFRYFSSYISMYSSHRKCLSRFSPYTPILAAHRLWAPAYILIKKSHCAL